MPRIRTCAFISGIARVLNFGPSLHLHPYLMYTSCKGSWPESLLLVHSLRPTFRHLALLAGCMCKSELFAPWVIFHAFLSSADFFKINFFKKFFQEYHQSVKQFGSILFAKSTSRRQRVQSNWACAISSKILYADPNIENALFPHSSS